MEPNYEKYYLCYQSHFILSGFKYYVLTSKNKVQCIIVFLFVCFY